MEPCGGFDRSAAPAFTVNGGNGNGSIFSQRAIAPKGDGARSADRLGHRPELAIPRDFSRKTSLRGVGWYQVCVAGQQACSRKWPRQAPRCSGGETARTRSTALAETARASPATRGGAARTSSTEVFETARASPRN